jgi:hypothetical protein
MAVTGLSQRFRSLVARLEALLEERLHLGDEDRVGELVGEDRRESNGDGRRNIVRRQASKNLQQRQVGVERCLTQPVASMGPASMVQHVRKVAVQGEDEVHRAVRHWAAVERATARRYTSR